MTVTIEDPNKENINRENLDRENIDAENLFGDPHSKEDGEEDSPAGETVVNNSFHEKLFNFVLKQCIDIHIFSTIGET